MRLFFFFFFNVSLQKNSLVFTAIGILLIPVHILIIFSNNSCNYWVVEIYA